MMSSNVVPQVSIKEILFVTDLTAASHAAMPYVIALASKHHSNVTLLHSLGPVPAMPVPDIPASTLYTKQLNTTLPELNQLADELKTNGVACQSLVRDGELWAVVNQEIASHSPDLIVCGASCHGSLHRLVFGSHAENVLRHAPCAVLLVGPKAAPAAEHWKGRIATILLATDFEQGSRHALDYIRPLAVENNSQLILLHIVPDVGAISLGFEDTVVERSRLELEVFARSAELPKPAKVISRIGMRAQEIVNVAEEQQADLIVLGKRKGGNLVSHSAASIIAAVAEKAPCPVLGIC